jgi:hypothetical protein
MKPLYLPVNILIHTQQRECNHFSWPTTFWLNIQSLNLNVLYTNTDTTKRNLVALSKIFNFSIFISSYAK